MNTNAALYQDQPDCAFSESGFDAYPDRSAELSGDEKLRDVVKVFDLGEKGAILYSEVKSQDCFLGIVQ